MLLTAEELRGPPLNLSLGSSKKLHRLISQLGGDEPLASAPQVPAPRRGGFWAGAISDRSGCGADRGTRAHEERRRDEVGHPRLRPAPRVGAGLRSECAEAAGVAGGHVEGEAAAEGVTTPGLLVGLAGPAGSSTLPQGGGD